MFNYIANTEFEETANQTVIVGKLYTRYYRYYHGAALGIGEGEGIFGPAGGVASLGRVSWGLIAEIRLS